MWFFRGKTKKQRIYLDWAASAPVLPASQKAFTRALAVYGNPGSPHEEGRQAKQLLEEARTSIARLVAVRPENVIFTGGATEANALGILGTMRARLAEGVRPHVLYQPGAHASIDKAMAVLSDEGADVESISVTGGAYDLVLLEAQLRPETALIVLQVVCGETGTRFDTRAVKMLLNKKDCRALVHVDASQLPLAEMIEHTRLGADMLVLDAQKVGGVRGIGALILHKRVSIEPLVHGGGQEGGMRPGTEMPALAQAFASALTAAEEGREAFAASARKARERMEDELRRELLRIDIQEGKKTVPHILNISFLGRDTDYLVALLDAAGIAVSTKSACESDSEEGSRAVLAQTGDEERARSTLRISWGPATAQKELQRATTEIVRAVRFMDENAI